MSFLNKTKAAKKRGQKLLDAVRSLRKRDVAELLAKNNIQVDVRDENGDTPFIISIIKGSHEIFHLLLKHNPPPDWNTKNANGFTPLMFAAGNGHYDMVQVLLELKPAPLVHEKNRLGKSAIDYAERNNHLEILQLLQKFIEGHQHDVGGHPYAAPRTPSTQQQQVNGHHGRSPSDQQYAGGRDPRRGPATPRHPAQADPHRQQQHPHHQQQQQAPPPQQQQQPRRQDPRGAQPQQQHQQPSPRPAQRADAADEAKDGNLLVQNVDTLKLSSLTLEKIPENKLGEGGCGVVWKGEYLGLTVAIKEMKVTTDINEQHEFIQEIHLQSRLHHPRIVSVIGICHDKNNLMLVTEYCPKKSLADVMRGRYRRKMSSSWGLRKRMAIEAAQGLAYLHERNILHLDLKPLNLMVDEDLHIKVGDFGISKLLTSAVTVSTRGWTPTYVSPEVMTGRPYGKPADVYSYGIVMYEIFTMLHPYKDAKVNSQVLLARICNGTRPTVPKDLPKGQTELLKACWHADPNKRPTFIDIIERLKTL